MIIKTIKKMLNAKKVHVSRHHIYSSSTEMEKDSDLVVICSLKDKTVVQDLRPQLSNEFTLYTMAVDEVVTGSHPQDTVIIRQLSEMEADYFNPKKDQRYLLYLKHSGLPGEASGHYYICGVNAGVYSSQDARTLSAPANGTERFVKSYTTEDKLPGEITR